MQVIFTQNHGSSRVDDVKNARPGYIRYLFRYGKATVATPEMVAEAESRAGERKKQIEAAQADARKVASLLSEIVLEFTEKSNTEGHLFGSVTEANIAEQLSEKSGREIKKDQVHMEHIKQVGEHTVAIHLAEGVEAKIQVQVKASE